jgi:hypothetical protein
MPAVVKPLISKTPFPFVIARAVPPSELPSKKVVPPAPPPVPPFVVIVTPLALEVFSKAV